MSIRQISDFLESIAPPTYQESYDNTGLLVGSPDTVCNGVLVCLDAIESAIDEAIAKQCNLVVAHHPIIFGGLKKLNGKNYIERTILKAIKNDIAIYAIHTNLDNVRTGVNRKICEKLALQNCRVLQQRPRTLKKMSVLCPLEHADRLRETLINVAEGWQNDHLSIAFSTIGVSTIDNGKLKEKSTLAELRLDIVFAAHLERAMINAMLKIHPKNNPTYEISTLDNSSDQIGSGMIGVLPKPMPSLDFLQHLKKAMQADCLKYTATIGDTVQRIALCGGTGIALLPDAIRQKADVFITADVKYHQFFDADQQITIADIGHYETEHFTTELLVDIISKKFPNFAVHAAQQKTNPVLYL
jgi:dinuclear metal center YbgI/SA1388 family protein